MYRHRNILIDRDPLGFSKFLSAAETDNDEAGNLTDCTLAAWRKAEFPGTKILGMPAKHQNVPD